MHTHGAYGYDTNDGEPEGLRNWMKHIPEEGVTSILPTTVTQMPDVLEKAVANVASVVDDGYEEPRSSEFISRDRISIWITKGAQPPEAIAQALVEQFKRYQNAA